MEPSTETKAIVCTHCGEEVLAEYDFCLECGHSVGWGSSDAAHDVEPTEAELTPCPSCISGHMRNSSYGHPQCESCGYIDRV